jgi:hypothetical protein
MFKLCNNIVTGENGECFVWKEDKDGKKRPLIPVSIKNEKTGDWSSFVNFVFDTGADVTTMHTDVAKELGIDTKKCDKKTTLGGISAKGISAKGISAKGIPAKGIPAKGIPAFYKNNVLIQIGDLEPFSMRILYSDGIKQGLKLLGRESILKIFGVAVDDEHVGFFPKN